MKALVICVLLSTGLAIGTTACAHQQLTNQQVARTAIPVALIVTAVVAGFLAEEPPAQP